MSSPKSRSAQIPPGSSTCLLSPASLIRDSSRLHSVSHPQIPATVRVFFQRSKSSTGQPFPHKCFLLQLPPSPVPTKSHLDLGEEG